MKQNQNPNAHQFARQSADSNPREQKQKDRIPDFIDKERFRMAFIATGMNPELCAAETGLDPDLIAKWIETDFGEIAEWKRSFYVKCAIDAFNQLLDIMKNEPVPEQLDYDGNPKKKPFASDAQVKAISIILDRLGHLIGLDPVQAKTDKQREKKIAILNAEDYLKLSAVAE